MNFSLKNSTKRTIILLFFTIGLLVLNGCSKDDNINTVEINIVQNSGDAEGTFSSNGDSGSKTLNWNNSLSNTNWDLDITNATSGTFRIQVWDANNVLILDKSLTAGSGNDSLSGTTNTGTASGNFKIVVTLTNFKGTGSFSLTPA